MKLKLFHKQFLLCLFIFLIGNPLVGQTYFVIPHHGNSLKIQKKNDLHLSIGGMLTAYRGQEKRDQQIQLGYAPLDYLGISIFHSKIKNININGIELIIHNSHHTGIEVGTFNKKILNNDKTQKSHLIPTFAF